MFVLRKNSSHMMHRLQGRIQEFILGGQTKVPNRKLSEAPESRAQSARELRAKPEKKRGEGSGEGVR